MTLTKRLCMLAVLSSALWLVPSMLSLAVEASAGDSGVIKNARDRQSTDKEREAWLKHASHSEVGKASWYGGSFHNRKTASGLLYDMHTFTAAHKTLPMGTVVRVTDRSNGKSVMVCVTDRGPYVRGRIIDLSWAAAQKLDFGNRGVSNVKLEVISDETGKPLNSAHAYYIRFQAGEEMEEVGPYYAFADAAAMHEALRQAHPDAELILGEAR